MGGYWALPMVFLCVGLLIGNWYDAAPVLFWEIERPPWDVLGPIARLFVPFKKETSVTRFLCLLFPAAAATCAYGYVFGAAACP